MQTIEEIKRIAKGLQGLKQNATNYQDSFETILLSLYNKAFALGTLNGLDKAIELIPEPYGWNFEEGELPSDSGQEVGFDVARGLILSKINEAKKLWN